MQLTARQKLSLVFSLYVSLFIFLVGAVFFVLLHFNLMYQVQKDAGTQATNALKNHIATENSTPVVVNDKTGGTLSDEVIESNVSILILNKDLKVIKEYGLFDLYTEGDQKSVNEIAKMANDSQNSLKSGFKVLSWRGQEIVVFVSPVKSNGQTYGSIVAAKSLTDVQNLEKVIMLMLLGFALASALASLFLSRLFIERIYKPIRDLTKIISGTSLDSLDKSIKVSGSSSDELVVLGEKFNQMISRLQSMSEQQKEFISNASHELKTPLSRAISSLDLAASGDSPASNTLKEIRDDLFTINSLLDKLMFLSKLKPGTILRSDKLSLNKVISDCIQPLKKNSKNVIFDLNLDSDGNIFLPKEYAEVLLSNLLSNALKYSRIGSTIIVGTKLKNSKILLKIEDRGIGINKSELRKVTERYYRGSTGNKTSGHGIGLSIVRRIVELYNIKFTIESEPDKGTRVVLELPVS